LCGKFTAAWTGSDDFQTAGGAGAIRWNGSLTYYSPQWHGWSADVGVAPAKDDDESSRYAVRVGYEQPQWEVHGAMEWSGKNTDLGDMSGLSSTDSRSRYRQAKARLNVLSAAYHWSKDASVAFGVAKLNQMFTFREGFITKTAFDPSSMAVTLRFKARLLDWFDEVGSETGFDDESQSPRKEIKKFDDDGEFRVSYAKASAGSQQEFLSTMWAVGYTQQLTKKLNWSVALARGESTLLGVNRKSTALEVSFKQRF
jgi:hypothetical protein